VRAEVRILTKLKMKAFFLLVAFSAVEVAGVKFANMLNDPDVTLGKAGELHVKRASSHKASMLQLPHDEGMMHNNWGDSYTNSEGEINIHAVMDTEDEVDPNTYPGENEEREIADDSVLRFKRGHRKPKIYRMQNQAVYSNEDLWTGA